MIMQNVSIDDLIGEWFCNINAKPKYYLKINSDKTYYFRDILNEKEWSNNLTIRYKIDNTIDIQLDGYGSIVLWMLSGESENEIELIIDHEILTFYRIIS